MTSDDISDDWIVTSLRGVVIIEKGNSIDKPALRRMSTKLPSQKMADTSKQRL